MKYNSDKLQLSQSANMRPKFISTQILDCSVVRKAGQGQDYIEISVILTGLCSGGQVDRTRESPGFVLQIFVSNQILFTYFIYDH